jgi:hypothetical protein
VFNNQEDILACGGVHPMSCFHFRNFTLIERNLLTDFDLISDVMYETASKSILLLVTAGKETPLLSNCDFLSYGEIRFQCNVIRHLGASYTLLATHKFYDLTFIVGRDSLNHTLLSFVNPGGSSLSPFIFAEMTEAFTSYASTASSPNLLLAGIGPSGYYLTLGLLSITPSPNFKELVIIDSVDFARLTIQRIFPLPDSQDILISGLGIQKQTGDYQPLIARVSSLLHLQKIECSSQTPISTPFHDFFVISSKLYGVFNHKSDNPVDSSLFVWRLSIVELNTTTCEPTGPTIQIRAPDSLYCHQTLTVNRGIVFICNMNQDQAVVIFTDHSLSFRNLPSGYRKVIVEPYVPLPANLSMRTLSNAVVRGKYAYTARTTASSISIATNNFTQLLPDSVAREYQSPSRSPTFLPSMKPSLFPTSEPSPLPSSQLKTERPSISLSPSSQPSSSQPTRTVSPSRIPSFPPSLLPTTPETMSPSIIPTTNAPQHLPTFYPSRHPTALLTRSPVYPSYKPTRLANPTSTRKPNTVSPSTFIIIEGALKPAKNAKKSSSVNFNSTWGIPIVIALGNAFLAVGIWWNYFSRKEPEKVKIHDDDEETEFFDAKNPHRSSEGNNDLPIVNEISLRIIVMGNVEITNEISQSTSGEPSSVDSWELSMNNSNHNSVKTITDSSKIGSSVTNTNKPSVDMNRREEESDWLISDDENEDKQQIFVKESSSTDSVELHSLFQNNKYSSNENISSNSISDKGNETKTEEVEVDFSPRQNSTPWESDSSVSSSESSSVQSSYGSL